VVVGLRAAAKRYRWRGPWVLRDVDVALAPGAVVEVRGANGTGKSTLLRLLAGATVRHQLVDESGDQLADVGRQMPAVLADPLILGEGAVNRPVRLLQSGELRGLIPGELGDPRAAYGGGGVVGHAERVGMQPVPQPGRWPPANGAGHRSSARRGRGPVRRPSASRAASCRALSGASLVMEPPR